MLKNAIWLWANSATVWEGKGFVVLIHRILFFVRALLIYPSVKPLIEAPRDSPLGRLMEDRPKTVGAVIWPYQCSGWNPRTRLARIRDHYAVVKEIGGMIDFPPNGKIALLDLSDIAERLNVIVDQPAWVLREGQLALSLFLTDIRIYTLVFSLFHHNNGIAAFVGSIQGRDAEGALEEYRELTKALHGIHPRNLLIKIFQMLCAELGIKHIFAVSDEYRHHRDRQYFGEPPKEKFHSNYNEIWEERGAARIHPMFYELAVGDRERSFDYVINKAEKVSPKIRNASAHPRAVAPWDEEIRLRFYYRTAASDVLLRRRCRIPPINTISMNIKLTI